MIKSFIHHGMMGLYLTGNSVVPEFLFDARCILIMDILECLDIDEPILPGLQLACLVGLPNFYCAAVQNAYHIIFEWSRNGISKVGLTSSDLAVIGQEASPVQPITRPRTHPGIVLREIVLPALGLSVAGSARQLGINRTSLFRFLAGGQRLNVECARRLGDLCGVSPAFWLRMQQMHDGAERAI